MSKYSNQTHKKAPGHALPQHTGVSICLGHKQAHTDKMKQEQVSGSAEAKPGLHV